MMELFTFGFPIVTYIALTIVFTVALAVVLTLCVCHGERDRKSQDYGIPGRLSSIAVDIPPTSDHNTLSATSNDRPKSNGRLAEDIDENGDLKYRTVVERALPDIPNGIPQSGDTDTDQTPDSGSECYATVSNKPPLLERNGMIPNLNLGGSKGELKSETIPISTSNTENSTQNNEFSTSTSGSSSTTAVTTHTYSHVQKPHHPYARLSNQLDSDPGTDEYDESQSSDRDRRTNYSLAGLPHSLSKPNLENDMSSPSSSSIGPSSDEARPTSMIAGQAVAGNIPSAEIPYMTPPLVEQPIAQREVPYTVISVREPLERVRMQTQKLRKRQQSTQGSSVDEPEGYYMEVPDDEQTYAEIESGPNSGESSTTYDHIEPRNPDFPPDPPTVESLKSVAQAHSRQASIASMSSFGSGGEGQSSTKDVSALYSVVDKGGKKSHPVVVPGSPNFDQRGRNESNVDELYAKVQKKRAGGTMSVSGIEDVLRTDAVGADDVFGLAKTQELPPELPPVSGRLQAASLFEPTLVRTLARRHSAEPGFSTPEVTDESEPGYASVNMTGFKNGRSNQKTNVDSDDPGYERIRRETESEEPGYEFIRNNGNFLKDGSDPGYESVSNLNFAHALNRKESDIGSTDPGYERVLRLRKPDWDGSDPEYECVKYLNRNDSDVEPGYEGIRLRSARKDSETADPGYETVKGSLRRVDSEKAEPGYEKVNKGSKQKSREAANTGFESTRNTVKRTDSEVADPGYEKIKKDHKRKENRGSDESLKRGDENDVQTLKPSEGFFQCQVSNGDSTMTFNKLLEPHLAEVSENRGDACDIDKKTTKSNYEETSAQNKHLENKSNSSNSFDVSHVSTYVDESSSTESGIIVSGERISIRINCTNSITTTQLPKNEPLEVLSVFNNATNLMLGGSPSIHSQSSETKIMDNMTDDCSVEVQSNLDYETASSGGSTLSSRYSTTNRRSTSNSITLFSNETDQMSDSAATGGNGEIIARTISNIIDKNHKGSV